MCPGHFHLMKTNREIIEAIIELLQDYNPEESSDESIIVLAKTIKLEPVEGSTHDALIAQAGNVQMIGFMLKDFINQFPQTALPSIYNALLAVARDKKRENYMGPLLTAVITGLTAEKPSPIIKPSKGIIKPFSGRDN